MQTGSILGRAVRRTEDPALLTGAALFTEDIPMPGALHAAFVRSTAAHARIAGVDAKDARAMPGVLGIYAAAELGLNPVPADDKVAAGFARPVLADEVVRYVGEPIAVVLAESRGQALDAAEVVMVDLDPFPSVTDPLRALEPDAPVLFPEVGTNVARVQAFEPDPDALQGAAVVVAARFVNQRLAPAPLEVNGILAAPDEDTGGLIVWIPHQAPFWFRDDLVTFLHLDEERVRVIAPAVGGGFGAKAATYPEQLTVVALANLLRRPIRYVETRSENLVAMTHGRSQVQDVEIGAGSDGIITGLRVRIVADMGAYPLGTFLPGLTRQMASGVYRIPRIDCTATCVVTNTTPIDSYRGAGRPEAAVMIERVMDQLAATLGVDPVELRRRNLIPKEEFPYLTATGARYDAGDYGRALDTTLRLGGYGRLRNEQAERRARGDVRQLGIGLSVYVEVTGWGTEFGSVEVDLDGRATVLTGTSPHGQGHETAFAQVVAGTMGIPFGDVVVRHSDTHVVPRGDGTMGSRSLQLGGSAVWHAGRAVIDKARVIAAHLLEASVDDVVLMDGEGKVGLAGVPERAFTWRELAVAAADPGRLPRDMEPGLAAVHDFEQGANTYPFGAHLAVVEVDIETGRVRLLRHVAVDDCGRILNPLLVRGQVHGGIAQGVAQALFEEVRYDEDGNPLSSSLMSYEMPTSADLPEFETGHTETPSPLNPLGAKGIGESGTVGSTPAVLNAVVDAVSHLGVRHIDMPLSPERVWRAIRDA